MFHCIATSTWPSSASLSKKMTLRCSSSLFSFRWRTKSSIPPSYWKLTLLVCPRSSTSSIFRPRVRKAVSRRRSARVAKSKSISSKISRSGRKVILVPVALVALPFLKSAAGWPRSYSWLQEWPSLEISSSSRSESALTTETPTPCSPPETL